MDFTTKFESLQSQESCDAKSFEGLVLQQEFEVGRLIKDGSCCWVYECSHVQDKTQKLVVKISNESQMLEREAKCLRRLENSILDSEW